MTVDILRKPDDIKVVCEGENNDAEVRTVIEGRKLLVYLKANTSLPKYICARWNYRADKPVKSTAEDRNEARKVFRSGIPNRIRHGAQPHICAMCI